MSQIPKKREAKTKTSASDVDLKIKLQSELFSRRSINPRYSLRAFARDLGIDNSRLSKILRGERPIGPELLFQISEKLNLSAKELSSYKNALNRKIDQSYKFDSEFQYYKAISYDTFVIIEDWRHYAVLELMKLSLFKPDINWISLVLGIDQVSTQQLVNRLIRVGLLKIEASGRWVDVSEGFSTHILSDFECTDAHRRHQIDILKLAIQAVSQKSMMERDQSSMMMATSKKKVIEAKLMIKKFRRDLTDFLEECDEKDSVFQLSIALFPLLSTEGIE